MQCRLRRSGSAARWADGLNIAARDPISPMHWPNAGRAPTPPPRPVRPLGEARVAFQAHGTLFQPSRGAATDMARAIAARMGSEHDYRGCETWPGSGRRCGVSTGGEAVG